MPDTAERIIPWPPKKEDLERLYLVEKLSAAKIAKVYGLKYRNPKVAESTVLYQLKKNGIKRRDPAVHIRKVTPQMVDEWVIRYLTGESLKQIAEDLVDPVTVWNHLKARGVVLRDKVGAQIAAVKKYERKPFGGDKAERAYMMGLRYGDLHVIRHGRAIRARVSTTHPAMADLFEAVFSPYAHVQRYPREAKLTGWEWTLECDLDPTFEFLLNKPGLDGLEALSRDERIAFLAGLFDAEGSVYLHTKRGRCSPEAAFSNTDKVIIPWVEDSLRKLGVACKTRWFEQNEDRAGVTGYSLEGRVEIVRFADVQLLLRSLPIRHTEKQAKAKIVQGMDCREPPGENLANRERWCHLAEQLEVERLRFIELAGKSIGDAHR